MSNKKTISAEFPFKSNYANVLGAKMHYVDEGQGDPILFLHGNPTSSYLWRNIIPYVTDHGRAIAPDLIGMGRSEKIDSAYRFHDHYRYLEAFIDELDLKNITLVIHDWGSGLGFHYAKENPDRVKAIAFMEAMIRPLNWSDFPVAFGIIFRMMRAPGLGWLFTVAANGFIKQIMPQSIVRKLSKAEKDAYARPYPTFASRQPIRQWPLEIPINNNPSEMYKLISEYSQWLQTTQTPKLLFYAQPGGLIPKEIAQWCEQTMPNLITRDIGPGLHYIQEDNPHFIGEELARWLTQM